jgi:glycosyltransferase involved in cell wall biosynthesis
MNKSAENNSRVWIASELYYPETTSTGYFMTLVAEALARDFKVSVLCGQPSYSGRGLRAPWYEVLNGVEIWRCRATTFDKNHLLLRIFNQLTISISILGQAIIRLGRGDLVMVVTNPPQLPYLLLMACKMRRARCVLLIEDLYPDVLFCLGMVKSTSIHGRLMTAASHWLYNGMERIIVLGRDVKKIVMRKMDSYQERVSVIPHCADTESICPRPRQENKLLSKVGLLDRFVVQYCGNIGRTHGIEALVEIAELLRCDPMWHFLLIGWGAKKKWAEQQKAIKDLSNLTILDPIPQAEFCDGLNACDVAIVPLVEGMTGISVPSRMYNILSSGKPIVAICDDGSELAMVVKEEGIGWVVEPGNREALLAALREARSDPSRLAAMGEQARRAAETKYAQERVMSIYREMIAEMRLN